MHDDGQIHALVKRTIDVVDACDGKWPDLPRSSGDIYVVNGRCSRLGCWVRGAMGVPHPILQHVLNRTVINNEQFRALGNQDDVLRKMIRCQVDNWLSGRVCACRTGLRIRRDR